MEQFAAGVRDREIIFPNESGAYDLSSNYRLPPAIVDELTEELFPLEGPPQRGSSLDKLPMDTSPGNRLPNRVLLHERVTSRRDLTSGRCEGRSTIDIGGRHILRVHRNGGRVKEYSSRAEAANDNRLPLIKLARLLNDGGEDSTGFTYQYQRKYNSAQSTGSTVSWHGPSEMEMEGGWEEKTTNPQMLLRNSPESVIIDL